VPHFTRSQRNEKSPGRGLRSSPPACMHGFANFRKFKSPVTFTLTLDRVKVRSAFTVSVVSTFYKRAQPWLHSVTHYGNVAVWMSWNVDIRRSMNSRDSFAMEGKSKISLRQAVVQVHTINDKHQFWAPRESGGGDRYGKVQLWAIVGISNTPWPWPWPRIGSRSHQHTQYMYRTTSVPNHMTVASRTTEIWPFKFREISTLGEVWTLVIPFLDGNSKIGLRKAVVQVPYYHHQPSVLSFTQKRRRR